MGTDYGNFEESRDIAAIWTPIGAIRPVRMPFGLKNAGVIAQGAVREMREEDLSPTAKDHSINIADDFGGFCEEIASDGTLAPDWDTLADSFIDHRL